ncbi:N-alpha-acetyltransferase, non-catalitic subunit [Polyrhizophydium stewartii]|uniref:N-alpha-acetyltransferase, non-catalitic subunit n=1 Tax=Polyrhizophydium stewartii TaxID=2732419 RepID=A0ABR4NIQ5_9FUNG
MASPAPPAARGSFADVTALVRSAAKELGTGELLLASHYSMFQAMSAVQILNPRFDTGCAVLSEQERGCMSVASIRGKRDWTVPEIMEWLSGQPVSQTVFTCVYLHDLPSVSSRIVHSFLQLLLCQMARARSFVHEQGIFFEEDFNMDLYGFELEPRGVKPSELQSSMLELIGKLKDAATKGASAADIDALSVDSDLSVARQHLTQLVARLEFILSLSQLLDAIQDFNPELIAGALPPLRESLALMIATQSSVKVDGK